MLDVVRRRPTAVTPGALALTARLFRAAPGPTVGLVLTESARSATAAWQAVLAGSLVGALSSGGGWVAPLLLLGATVLALPTLQQLSRVLTTTAEGGLLLALRRDVAVGSLSAPTLDHLDDEVAMRRLRSTVRDVDSWVVRESVDMLRSLLGARLAGIAFFVVAARWNLLVATSVAICAWWLGRASRPFVTSVLGGWQDEGHGDEDRAHYLARLAVDPLSAPEVRVFGWSGWLDESARALRRRARESSASARARSMRPLGLRRDVHDPGPRLHLRPPAGGALSGRHTARGEGRVRDDDMSCTGPSPRGGDDRLRPGRARERPPTTTRARRGARRSR